MTASVSRDEEWIELMEVFVPESLDMLDEVEPQLIDLERLGKAKGDVSHLLNAIFRLFHSLKGGAGCLKLDVIREVTHSAENLLELFRNEPARIGSEHIDLLCNTCDLVRRLLGEVAGKYTDHSFENEVRDIRTKLVEALTRLNDSPRKDEVLVGSIPSEKTTSSPPQRIEKIESPTISPSSPSGSLSAKTLTARETQPKLADSLGELKLDITTEMRRQFVEEAMDLIDEAERSLLDLEKNPKSNESLLLSFRAIHSLKGNASFFGFYEITEVSHNMESLLDRMRDKLVPSELGEISRILSGIDLLRKGISQIRDGLPLDMPERFEFFKTLELQKDSGPVGKNGTSNPKLGEILIEMDAISNETLNAALTIQNSVKPPPEEGTEELPVSAEERGLTESKRQAIRVDIEKLDKLLDLVGELVISQSTVINNPDLAGLQLDRFEKATYQLKKITKDLQGIAMSVRMVPITSLFRKMVRLVRDLGQKCDKKIDFRLVGEETEVDKTVVELMSDPLVHMIRNSVDHGIEGIEERKSKGKPETGTIILEARYSGSEVWIIVNDDGRGLDRSKICEKAVEMGLLRGNANELRDEDVFKFIFEPGFSTASKVTDVSGRGVGMDVVKQNIEKLRGRVEISSVPANGAVFTIRIPLTLAIIDGMMVRVGNERYILPTQSIIEAFKPSGSMISTITNKGKMITVRNSLIPLFRISSLFNLADSDFKTDEGIIIVIEDGGKKIGVFADEIIGQQQTVIKSLGGSLGEVPGIAGAAVLADGRVGLILDTPGLIGLATRGTVS